MTTPPFKTHTFTVGVRSLTASIFYVNDDPVFIFTTVKHTGSPLVVGNERSMRACVGSFSPGDKPWDFYKSDIDRLRWDNGDDITPWQCEKLFKQLQKMTNTSAHLCGYYDNGDVPRKSFTLENPIISIDPKSFEDIKLFSEQLL